jgi:hypothetical protein
MHVVLAMHDHQVTCLLVTHWVCGTLLCIANTGYDVQQGFYMGSRIRLRSFTLHCGSGYQPQAEPQARPASEAACSAPISATRSAGAPSRHVSTELSCMILAISHTVPCNSLNSAADSASRSAASNSISEGFQAQPGPDTRGSNSSKPYRLQPRTSVRPRTRSS